MKTIGLIGGMSWESSQEYYRIINQEIRARLGGTHSAKSLMWSMDFGEIEQLQHQGKWEELTRLMIEAAQNLEKGGADFILICTNTMHKMAADVENATSIPLVHIPSGSTRRRSKTGVLLACSAGAASACLAGSSDCTPCGFASFAATSPAGLAASGVFVSDGVASGCAGALLEAGAVALGCGASTRDRVAFQ